MKTIKLFDVKIKKDFFKNHPSKKKVFGSFQS